jgi:hypothetical protein
MASLHPPQLLLGLNLLIFSAFYAWAGIYAARRITTRLYFREMMISMSLWSACYGAEILASRLETKLIWAKIGYIGIVSLPVFWLLFSLTFSGYVERLNPRRQRLLWVLPLLTLGMVFTNEWHHGIWSRYWLDPASPFHLAIYEHGWYFWVHTLYSYGLIFIGTAILGLASFQLAGIYRLQVISVFLGMILALIPNAVYLSGPDPHPWPGCDPPFLRPDHSKHPLGHPSLPTAGADPLTLRQDHENHPGGDPCHQPEKCPGICQPDGAGLDGAVPASHPGQSPGRSMHLRQKTSADPSP